jgi:hypothetical protein
MLISPSLPRAPIVYGPKQEPPELRGALFQQEPDGTVKILRTSGQTSPISPPDIGDDAAVGGEVFISVNGIDQDWAGHRQQIKDWYHGGFSTGANWSRPIIGIHEGDRKGVSDQVRILKNTLLLKTLQAGLASVERVRKAAYANDPSVKTIYDQLRQSLAVGRQVTLMAHSGGGSQVALAMSLLAQEQDGLWEGAIGSQVRVMATAATATRDDLRQAGLLDKNMFMTYSKRDSVPGFYRTPTDLRRPSSLLRAGVRGLSLFAREKMRPGPWHQGHYIFGQNMTPDGSRIVQFLEGGRGGIHPVP